MKYSYIVLILAIIQDGLINGVLTEAKIEELDRGNCSKLVSYRASRLTPYIETYKQKTWGIFYKTLVRWNYKTEYYTSWRRQYECCDGYRLNSGFGTITSYCEPVCAPACGDGTCVAPDTCLCFHGYSKIGKTLFDSACVPVCNHTCVHGTCTAPDVCTCDRGYSLSADGYTCEPVCNLRCLTGSYCSEPSHCACLNGYTDIILNDLRILNRCRPVCESECIHGECTAPDTCTCNDGYEPDPDNLFACKPKCEHSCLYGTCTAPNVCTCNDGYSLKNPGVCEPICSEVCIMGTCIAPESCSCLKGYGLLENSKYICEPVCEKACLNGKCTAPGQCTCNEGFQLDGDESAKHVCQPYCKIPCGPFGACTAPNVCTCFERYRLIDKMQIQKIDVQYFADNSICEPICDTACINGFCSAPETCTCNKGYRPSNTSNVCEPSCETDCINGYCSAPNECTCNSGYELFEANFTSLCEPICNPSCKNGICVQPNVCNCKPGYRQSTHSTNTCDPICHPICEKRNGICETPNYCVCKVGYRMNAKWNTFKCEPICGVDCGNGTCTAPDLCTCFDGYRNAETGSCEPVCSVCNNGTCVAPEICECDDGFVLEHWDIVHGNWKSRPEDRPGHGSRCVPRCESCVNGECVAPNECRCQAGFVKVEGICMHACQDGCGTHGKCNDERRTCECTYGWTGPHCDQATMCVSILSDERNHTEPLRISEEQNATIEHILINNPMCPECINKINNKTLCFKMHVNGTKDEMQIGCLINTECLASSSQYRDQKRIIKLSAIAGGFGILLLIGIAVYMLVRKHRNGQMSPDDVQITCRHSTSTQGLIEQTAMNS